MITLNTDTGLVKIEKWEDIEALPNFQINLNPLEHELESIIGRYIFPEKIKCGLSNCHSPHNKGYIVKTKDNSKTNIGKDCGMTYFGVDFETLSKKFDRDTTESENRDRLWSFSFRIDDYEDRLSHLRHAEKGGDWVYKKSLLLVSINNDCPNDVVRKIQEMCKARTNILRFEREATLDEIETIEQLENRKIPRPHYIQEDIAQINGLSVLYPENNLKEILINQIEENLKAFKKLNIDLMTFSDLKFWSKWTNSLDTLFENSESIINQGRVLLTDKNLQPFQKILNNSSDKLLFNKFLKSI